MSTVELFSDKAPSVDLTVYRNEIYNFLQTTTIKYDPLVEGNNDYVERAGGTVDRTDPSTWKYYKNVIGEYHAVDTPMYIRSFDTQEVMLFSKENLARSPRTTMTYSVGQDAYNELCQLYPAQTDLIKGIRYPLSDWKTAYNAANLTYLNGDESIFEINERDTLIKQLNDTLAFISFRWDFAGTDAEPLYPWVFWGEIWHILATALFAQRFENIRYSEVHSWHVWQFITSQGLSDYSDLLTFSQSMFLYRNLNYLNANRGKQSNLLILANNLLKEWSLTLYGRDVIQRTDTGANEALLYPDLVAKIIQSNDASSSAIPPTSVQDMVYKLINVGNELPTEDYDATTNAERQERLLSDTTVNTYPTKVVEIAPVDKNKKYADQFDTFIYDSLIYGISSGRYNPTVELPSRINQQVVLLDAKNLLLLFSYCMYKSLGEEPTIIPTVAKSALALKPAPISIRQKYKLDGYDVDINNYVNLYDYTNGNYQMVYDQSNPSDFSNAILGGFETLVHQVSLQRLNANARVGRIMRLITKNMLIIGDVKLNLTDAKTYTEWLSKHTDLKTQIIDPIEANAKETQDNYADLAADLVDTLVPITNGFNQYGDYQVTDSSYQRIKQLFTQLTSYNITFVDDNTSSPKYYFLPQEQSSIWGEHFDADLFYAPQDMGAKVTDNITDSLSEIIIDNLIDIGHDKFVERNAAKCPVGTHTALVEDPNKDVLYSPLMGIVAGLTLPDAPTPNSV